MAKIDYRQHSAIDLTGQSVNVLDTLNRAFKDGKYLWCLVVWEDALGISYYEVILAINWYEERPSSFKGCRSVKSFTAKKGSSHLDLGRVQEFSHTEIARILEELDPAQSLGMPTVNLAWLPPRIQACDVTGGWRTRNV